MFPRKRMIVGNLRRNTGIRAGSLQFGPDGQLYAGGTARTGQTSGNPNQIFRIDLGSGAATALPNELGILDANGDPIFISTTGLTLVGSATVIPEPGTIFLCLLIGIGFVWRRSRRRAGSLSE